MYIHTHNACTYKYIPAFFLSIVHSHFHFSFFIFSFFLSFSFFATAVLHKPAESLHNFEFSFSFSLFVLFFFPFFLLFFYSSGSIFDAFCFVAPILQSYIRRLVPSREARK